MHGLPSSIARPARRRSVEPRRSGYLPRALHNGLNLMKLALVLVLASLTFQTNAAAQFQQTRRVLILNEPGSWPPRVANISQEIFTALGNLPYHIEFYTEDVDANLLQDEAAQCQFRDWYFQKYRDRKPDLIVAVDPSPIKLMAASHGALAPHTPIVFWGSAQEFAEPPKLDSDFTGVWGMAQPEETLETALRLRPGTKHVVVSGIALYDHHLKALAKVQFRKYELLFRFTYLTDLAIPDLLGRLKHLPRHTIVYRTSILQDAAGTRLDDEIQSVPMVAGVAKAPVFAVDEEDVGGGTVGDDVLSSVLAGQVAATMAARILNGEKPQDIPISSGANRYAFDWRTLRQWGFKESDLPPGSVLLERAATFWEVYQRRIIAGIFVLLAQAAVIMALLWQRGKRRQTEVQLLRSCDQLRLAMESGKAVGWEWDLASGRDSWFGDLRTMFGVPSDSSSGKVGDFFRYVHPDDKKRVTEAVAEARQNHKLFTAEFRLVREDGAIRWVVSRGAFEYGRKGNATRTLGMAVDVTELKLAEEALKSSEEKFSKAFRESPLAVTLTNMQNHRYLEVNETFERLIGRRRDEVLGRTPLEIELWVDPGQRKEMIKGLLAEGTVRNLEAKIRRKDGEIRSVLGSSELIDIQGEPCALSMFADVTDLKKAEEAERRSKKRFEQFFETLPEYCFMTSADGEIQDVNPAACGALGYSKEELVGKPVSFIYVPDALPRLIDLSEKWKAIGTLHDEEIEVLTKQGQKRTVLVNAGSVKDTEGSLLQAMTVLVDITERKQIQDRLRKSDERSRDLVRRSPIAMVVTEGPQLRIIMMNDRFTSLFGYTVENVPDMGHWWPLAYPDEAYRNAVKAEWETRVERALNDCTEIEPMEEIVRCKDGSSRYIEFHFSPVGDANVVTFVDLTDRKHAETVLQESEERFRNVANTAPVMIWMSGIDKLCTYFNWSWLQFTGRSLDEELGSGWTKEVHPDDLPGCWETYAEAFDRREAFQMEYRLRRYDREYRWMFDQAVPRFNSDGSFAGYIGSCIDVTDRKLAQEALSDMSRKLIEAQEQERTWIARELHDDITQQVALLTVNLERLKQDFHASDSAGVVHSIEETIKDLSGLGRDVQALSHRLHSSKLEYLGVATAASSFCKELSEQHGVQIDFHSERIPRELRYEISLCLFRILQESLQNAIKHSGSPRFEVRLSGTSNEIELSVRDWGIGFNPEDAMRGHGLGLTSMRERLRLVHGELSVDSQPQLGATIRARVALRQDSKAAKA
jgi:PAS domain S-box-containing protein